MVLSVLLGKSSDLVVVSALLVVNAALSFMQERRPAGVLETLRRRLQVSARVLREGSWEAIPARELVPWDIRSRARRRHHPGRRNACRGEGNGMVMLTGAQTYFGRTTELVQYSQ